MFWSEERWLALPDEEKPVRPFCKDALQEAKCLLSVGDEVYVSSKETPRISKLTDDNDGFTIEPGQFAIILTAERVILPLDVIGFISMRTGVKLGGLVNISGFNVDPGYSGRLIFAAFNAGPTRINFRKGDRIFSIWLADVAPPRRSGKIKVGYEHIPADLINRISGEFVTAYQVKAQYDALREDVTRLKAFRLYALVVLTAVGLILFPIIKDRLVAIFTASSTPPLSVVPASR